MFWYQAVRLAKASASCRYRIGHFIELLGGATAVIDRRPQPAIRDARSVVVVRPSLDDAAREALADAKRRGTRVIADYDDLLFAGDPAEHPLVMNRTLSSTECARRIEAQRRDLSFFDGFTVSTEALHDELRALTDKPVTWVPNGLSARWVAQGRLLHRAWRPGDARVIRYLSGSPSHDADFAEIASPLAIFLRGHPEVTLEIVGPVKLDSSEIPAGQLRRLPRVPYVDLPRLLAPSWVTLAPLRNTRFNACRSAIKFLESAAFGTPCVATPTADTTRHQGGGVVLARDPGGWYRALTSLLDDDRRLELGLQGRRWIERHGYAAGGADAITHLMSSWPATRR